jgi:non-ribosomal peptide synthetase component E (peptide arylation enzyme)
MKGFMQRLASHAKEKGSKVAVIDKKGRWTYRQLMGRSQELAQVFLARLPSKTSGKPQRILHVTDANFYHASVQVVY